MSSKIVKTTVTENSVAIQLENGVTMYVNPNKDYFSISLSGIDLPVEVSHNHFCRNLTDIPSSKFSNVFDISYKQFQR